MIYVCHPQSSSILYSLDKYLSSTHYVPDTILGAMDRIVGKMDKKSRFHGTYNVVLCDMNDLFLLWTVWWLSLGPQQALPACCHLLLSPPSHYHCMYTDIRDPQDAPDCSMVLDPILHFPASTPLLWASLLPRRAFNLQVLLVIQNHS